MTLEPCPFCGGEAEWRDDPGVCDVPFGLVVAHKDHCFLNHIAFEEADIISAWNTRAGDEALQALLDGRDKFIVERGLWGEFVDQLPDKRALSTHTERAVQAGLDAAAEIVDTHSDYTMITPFVRREALLADIRALSAKDVAAGLTTPSGEHPREGSA